MIPFRHRSSLVPVSRQHLWCVCYGGGSGCSLQGLRTGHGHPSWVLLLIILPHIPVKSVRSNFTRSGDMTCSLLVNLIAVDARLTSIAPVNRIGSAVTYQPASLLTGTMLYDLPCHTLPVRPKMISHEWIEPISIQTRLQKKD